MDNAGGTSGTEGKLWVPMGRPVSAVCPDRERVVTGGEVDESACDRMPSAGICPYPGSMIREPSSWLWEREAELAALDAVLMGAASGTGGGLMLTGVGGIGKSSLLEVARRRATYRSLRVIGACGGALEHQYAFGVTLQLRGGRAEDPAELSVLLAGAGGAAAPVLAPSSVPFNATCPAPAAVALTVMLPAALSTALTSITDPGFWVMLPAALHSASSKNTASPVSPCSISSR